MKRKNFPHRKEERQLSAEQRRADRNSRSAEDQLKKLDKLLGKNKGASKERGRLSKQVTK